MTRQCLLDAYQMTQCPNCGRTVSTTVPTGQEQILCSLKNEGGLQENLDILPILAEESYLRAFPEERKCRAFLQFCASGDVEAITDMLQDEDEEEGDDGGGEADDPQFPPARLLRYQDGLGSLDTGLHLAVANDKTEIAWLLLVLASSLETSRFPPEVIAAARGAGISRPDQVGLADIRSLKNSQGMTAGDLAKSKGGVWDQWLTNRTLD